DQPQVDVVRQTQPVRRHDLVAPDVTPPVRSATRQGRQLLAQQPGLGADGAVQLRGVLDCGAGAVEFDPAVQPGAVAGTLDVQSLLLSIHQFGGDPLLLCDCGQSEVGPGDRGGQRNGRLCQLGLLRPGSSQDFVQQRPVVAPQVQ